MNGGNEIARNLKKSTNILKEKVEEDWLPGLPSSLRKEVII
jgi:hypothetical protein